MERRPNWICHLSVVVACGDKGGWHSPACTANSLHGDGRRGGGRGDR